jgi:transposase
MEMIGLDIHKKECQPTVIDEEGNIYGEKRFESSTEAIRAFFLRHPNAKVAIESTGIWEHVYKAIRSCGNQVVLANPLKTRLIKSIHESWPCC